jgi:hypothetical protein
VVLQMRALVRLPKAEMTRPIQFIHRGLEVITE